MRLALSCLSGALCAAVLPPVGAAHAQRVTEAETGSLIRRPQAARIPDRSARDADRAYIAMLDFGRCTLDRRTSQVERALRLPVGREASAALGRAASDECLDTGEMRFQPVLLRGALFIEMWKRRALAKAKGVSWGFDLDPIVVPVIPPEATKDQKLHWGLMTYASCVVQTDRAAASEAVTQRAGEPKEMAAYQRLSPALSGCLAEGETLSFSKAILGGALAEVLYRTSAADQ